MDDIVKVLDPIFKPETIVVIGASNDPKKWGYRMVYDSIYSGYGESIYPINLREKEIASLKACPSIFKVPESFDFAACMD